MATMATMPRPLLAASCVAQPRLSLLHDGRVLLELKREWNDGTSVSPRGPVRARLLEFVAIAAANLGRHEQHVRRIFDLAMLDNPFDPTIRKNAAAYEKATTAPVLHWESINPVEARRDFEQSLRAAS
jgi:hypothetical protein